MLKLTKYQTNPIVILAKYSSFIHKMKKIGYI